MFNKIDLVGLLDFFLIFTCSILPVRVFLTIFRIFRGSKIYMRHYDDVDHWFYLYAIREGQC